MPSRLCCIECGHIDGANCQQTVFEIDNRQIVDGVGAKSGHEEEGRWLSERGLSVKDGHLSIDSDRVRARVEVPETRDRHR